MRKSCTIISYKTKVSNGWVCAAHCIHYRYQYLKGITAMKTLPIDYYINGFNVEQINCYDLSIACASGRFNPKLQRGAHIIKNICPP